MAWNKTYAQLKTEVEVAIEQKKDFAYETNFNHEPLHWLNKFKKAGYLIHLIYFCLESAELAIQRVAIRFQNGGHYVPDAEVNERYTAGFNNLDNYYDEFNAVLVIDGSSENQKPKTLFLCDLDSGVKQIGEILPGYFNRQCPRLSNFILST
jgi:predicted ABC-type ATPase